METLFRDVTHALRMFRQSGVSFVLTAVVALGLGIGANTAIFSLVNTVLLKEPPFPGASRIVILESKSPEGENNAASPAKFAYWAQQTSVVQDVAAFNEGVMNWTSSELPIQLRTERVTSKYFSLFGAPFILGRPFNAQEDSPGASPAVVISEGLWARRFGRDASVVGKTMLLGGEPYSITGVISQRFDFQDFGKAPEIWVPFQLDPNSPDQGHYFQAAGRLRAGVTLAQARAELGASTRAYNAKFPNALDPKEAFGAMTLRDSLVRGSQTSIWILMGAVGFVLLIACSECGQSPAGARGIEKTGTGHSSRARGGAGPYDPAVDDREFAAVRCWSRVRAAARMGRYAYIARGEYRWIATRRRRR